MSSFSYLTLCRADKRNTLTVVSLVSLTAHRQPLSLVLNTGFLSPSKKPMKEEENCRSVWAIKINPLSVRVSESRGETACLFLLDS
jgi:hypothetical protein